VGLKLSENIPFSTCVHHRIPSMHHVPPVSTSVEPSSTSLSTTSIDVVCVNHVSHSHGIDNGFTFPSPTTSLGHVGCLIPILHFDAFEEGNMTNISPTSKVNIDDTPGFEENILLRASCSPKEISTYKVVFQEFCDIFAWSCSDMPSLDLSIIECHIDTWSNVIPIHQKQRPIHLGRALDVKVEIDKLQKVGFIYPITYTSWVSNLVPIMKKQGTIHVCTDFHDLNNACPKYNYPKSFIDLIINKCTGHEFLPFMDGLSCYN
jgi:hypothetical protein